MPKEAASAGTGHPASRRPVSLPNEPGWFASLVQSSSDAIYALDLDHRVISWNPAAERIYGYAAGDIIGRSINTLVPSDRAGELAGILARLARGERIIEFETVWLHADGTPISVALTISPVSGEAGQPVGYSVIARDITDRKRAEEQLRRSQLEAADFIENAVIPLHWVSGDGILLWANKAELDLLGYEREDYIGRHIREFHADPATIDDILARLSNRQELHNYPARLRCRDGTTRHVLISSNVRWDGNRFLHTRCFTADVTEKHRTSQLMDHQRHTLERIAQGAPLPEILADLVETIENFSQSGVLASILLTDKTGRRLMHGAAGTILRDFAAAVEGVAIGPEGGTCGAAAHFGHPVSTPDIASDPNWANYRQAALGRGLRACWSMPILSVHNRVLGAFALYYRQPREPDPEDMAVTAVLARTAAIAIAQSRREEKLRLHAQIVGQLHESVISTDLDGIITSWNDGATRLFGYTAAEMIGRPIARLYPPNQQRFLEEQVIAPTRAKGCHEIDIEVTNKSGEIFHAHCGLSMLYDETGEPIGMIGYSTDITARRRAEAALRESEERLRAALIASGTGTFRWNIRTGELYGDASLQRLFDLDEMEGGRPVSDYIERIHPEDRGTVSAAVERGAREGADIDLEFRVVLRDGGIRWLADKGKALSDEHGPLYMTGACHDITERRRAERQQRLLLAELSHRVKNMLATVLSVAAQTRRGASSLEDFVVSFRGRIQALAQTHDLLAASSWTGARITDMIAGELRPYGNAADGNIAIQGDDLSLNPRAALALIMAVHELATNAAKHGSLSVPGGRIEIRWQVRFSGEESLFALTWRESGGPPIAMPSRRGFGCTFIENGLKYELGGGARLDFRAEGLICEIEIPLARVAASSMCSPASVA